MFSIAQDDVFAMPKALVSAGLAGLLAVVLVAGWIVRGRPKRAPSVLGVAVTVFVGWNLLAAWFAIDQPQALLGERYQYQGLVAMLAYMVFLVGAWNTVRTHRRRTVLAGCVATAALIVAGYAVLQRAGLDPIWPTLPRDRVFSTIGQANALAASLVVALPLAVSLCIGRRSPLQLLGYVTLGLGLAAIAFTLSRGGYLGLSSTAITLVAAAAVGGYGRRVTGRRLAAASLGRHRGRRGQVMAVPTLRAGAERIADRALLTADLAEGSTRMHLDQWAVAAAIVADHPVLGTGQDTYVPGVRRVPGQTSWNLGGQASSANSGLRARTTCSLPSPPEPGCRRWRPTSR